jgi:hypothetical protein
MLYKAISHAHSNHQATIFCHVGAFFNVFNTFAHLAVDCIAHLAIHSHHITCITSAAPLVTLYNGVLVSAHIVADGFIACA